ncbi:hypothetical protein SKAU_G00295500 [Synaphobranchus kaupii]|uniref:Uncharacterized protein n=1 Tax=Synaphobranchus kaupii TaxID=118154 RepID=A0A9Q1ILS8_SYNKA|nr:hypothetical protein SKAU_G00295500 [Synaphobranchus kaupii]
MIRLRAVLCWLETGQVYRRCDTVGGSICSASGIRQNSEVRRSSSLDSLRRNYILPSPSSFIRNLHVVISSDCVCSDGSMVRRDRRDVVLNSDFAGECNDPVWGVVRVLR